MPNLAKIPGAITVDHASLAVPRLNQINAGLGAGLGAAWPFWKGTAEDYSTNTNPLSMTGDASIAGETLQLDGSGYAAAASTLSGSTWSLAFRLTHDSTGAARAKIAGHGTSSSTLFLYYDLQRIYIENAAGTLSGQINIALASNTEQHVVLVADGSTLAAYLDGAFADSVSIDTDFDLSRIGRGNSADADSDFKGEISSVLYWSRALSAAEITALNAEGTIDYRPHLPATQFLFHPSLTGDVAAGGSFTEESVNRGTCQLNGDAYIDRDQGLVLDGDGDYVTMPVPAAMRTSQGAFGVWVVCDAIGDIQYPASITYTGNDDSFLGPCRIAPDGEITSFIRTTFTTPCIIETGTSIVVDSPTHVLLQSDGSSYDIYINGSVQSLAFTEGDNDGAWLTDFDNTADTLALGCLVRDVVGCELDGLVLGAHYLTAPLSAAQVSSLMLQTAPPGVDARTILGI